MLSHSGAICVKSQAAFQTHRLKSSRYTHTTENTEAWHLWSGRLLLWWVCSVGACPSVETQQGKSEKNWRCKINATANENLFTIELEHLSRNQIHFYICILVSCILFIAFNQCKCFHGEGILDMSCLACCCPFIGSWFFLIDNKKGNEANKNSHDQKHRLCGHSNLNLSICPNVKKSNVNLILLVILV